MEYVEVIGLDEAIRAIDRAPANLQKIARKAMGEGAKAGAKSMRAMTPTRWRRLVKGRVMKTYDGKLNAGIGLFNGKQVSGHQNPSGARIADWFKAYWANYGTLENRDPNHTFTQPVKHANTAAAARRKNKRGQKAQNFFEKAVGGVPSAFEDGFLSSLDKQNQDIFK